MVRRKTLLISQAKEAESLRNKEMKKYAEDRERCLKQQNEVEILTAQLEEKIMTFKSGEKNGINWLPL